MLRWTTEEGKLMDSDRRDLGPNKMRVEMGGGSPGCHTGHPLNILESLCHAPGPPPGEGLRSHWTKPSLTFPEEP